MGGLNMLWIIFILIWICSFVIHIIWTYYENKRVIFRVGDLIDKIEFFMWFPIVNTSTLIGVTIFFIIDNILHLLKLPELWEKFRNIKLK